MINDSPQCILTAETQDVFFEDVRATCPVRIVAANEVKEVFLWNEKVTENSQSTDGFTIGDVAKNAKFSEKFRIKEGWKKGR